MTPEDFRAVCLSFCCDFCRSCDVIPGDRPTLSLLTCRIVGDALICGDIRCPRTSSRTVSCIRNTRTLLPQAGVTVVGGPASLVTPTVALSPAAGRALLFIEPIGVMRNCRSSVPTREGRQLLEVGSHPCSGGSSSLRTFRQMRSVNRRILSAVLCR